MDFRAAGWRLRDGRLAMRSRVLARTTLLAPAARLQEHATAQNPFQRRAGLADLAVAVGKGGGRASATSRRRSPPSCGSGCGHRDAWLVQPHSR